MRVIIYSLTDVFYNSYYIEGFYSIFGRNNVSFSMEPFPNFPERVFAAILQDKDQQVKIIIDADDTSRISTSLLEWCDVYGKVNFNKKNITTSLEKIIPIGPSFGIKIWSLPVTIVVALKNYLTGRKKIFHKRNFFANYWRQYKRLPLKLYLSGSGSSNNYIYFISSLWKKEVATNSARALFIEACREVDGINFEGGFAPRSDKETLGYDNLIGERIKLKNYLNKIKKSLLVFNTPAVENCHGWKLAEYLALGKAIISTEISNELSSALLHEVHLHIVENEKEAIKEAIITIQSDKTYKKRLQKNAQNYYMEHLTPGKVIQKLIDNRYIN